MKPRSFLGVTVRTTSTALLAALLLSGCYRYRTHVPEVIDGTTPRSETVWSLAWASETVSFFTSPQLSAPPWSRPKT